MKFLRGKGTQDATGQPRMSLRSCTSLTPALRRFAREEDGNLTIAAVAFFVGAALICGIGVDLMMNEMKRTNLQHTLDRAILAAADLDQELGPQSVVEDYFETSGLSDALSSVTVEQGLNFRTVSADAVSYSDPLFIKSLGVERLVAPAAGTAEERIANVEISMVLDISGSMGEAASDGGTKIENLRAAAKEFVDTVIQEEGGGLTTVNIVPYNATVNLGSVLSEYYTLSDEHDYSRCARFPTNAFTELGISRTVELERIAHFSPWENNWNSASIQNPWCAASDYGSVMVHSSDKTALKAHIDSLGHGGNTAIDLGMKWGVALLDPSAQSLVTDMIADGHIAPEASGRPKQYTDREAMKIVVLMTDGRNTNQRDLKQFVKSGMSPVYIDEKNNDNPYDDDFSVLVKDEPGTGSDVWYWHDNRGGDWNEKYRNYSDGGARDRQMSYKELYARFGAEAVENMFFEPPYYDGWWDWSYVKHHKDAWENIVTGEEGDYQLGLICDAARDSALTVFAIGFEAPQEGKDAMMLCASSPSHYFDVQGVEISDAFSSIARTINQLRLTQ